MKIKVKATPSPSPTLILILISTLSSDSDWVCIELRLIAVRTYVMGPTNPMQSILFIPISIHSMNSQQQRAEQHKREQQQQQHNTMQGGIRFVVADRLFINKRVLNASLSVSLSFTHCVFVISILHFVIIFI